MKVFSKDLFTARLRSQRGDRSQRVMAAMCDMKQPMYARYESGATLPSAEQLFRLCDALNCTADYFLGLTDEPEPLRASAPPREIKSSPHSAVAVVTGNNNKISQVINPQKRKART